MFGFLIPIVKIALRAVLGEVLSVERLFGAGKGTDKLAVATENVSSQLGEHFELSKVAESLDEVVALVKAVVEVLNALGLLDEVPGFDIDYGRLVPAAKQAFSALAELADALG